MKEKIEKIYYFINYKIDFILIFISLLIFIGLQLISAEKIFEIIPILIIITPIIISLCFICFYFKTYKEDLLKKCYENYAEKSEVNPKKQILNRTIAILKKEKIFYILYLLLVDSMWRQSIRECIYAFIIMGFIATVFAYSVKERI